MNKNFSLSTISKDIKAASAINPQDINKYDKMETITKFLNAKKNHPGYSKKQLCSLLGISDSTLKRNMKDLDIKSFYRHNVPVNKSKHREDRNKTSERPSKEARKTSSDDSLARAKPIEEKKILRKGGANSRASFIGNLLNKKLEENSNYTGDDLQEIKNKFISNIKGPGPVEEEPSD